jgi:flagellar biosynthesis protein FlhG
VTQAAPDQAQRLRELVSTEKRARVLSFTSGKGGVGKTNISLSMALSLIAMKKKVALLDFDLGLANVNVFLNCPHRYNLSHFISGEKDLSEVMVEGPGGLLFLPGANGLSELADMNPASQQKLLKGLESLEREVDFIILDTGAGISSNVLSLSAAAHDVIVITTPEPTAILDAYSMIRSLRDIPGCGRLNLLVNQVKERKDAIDVADRICGAAKKFLNHDVKKMGYVFYDRHVNESVINRRPFILDNPKCDASSCVEAMARYLAQIPEPEEESGGFFKRLFHVLFERLPARKAG